MVLCYGSSAKPIKVATISEYCGYQVWCAALFSGFSQLHTFEGAVLSKLSQLGFDSKQFGLLSLRSGGASAAATASVPDRLFKRHG